jgi:predicted RNA-binding Zn ribbon-like protein
MLDVTWEWIGVDKAAFDVANTVAISGGVEHDLLEPDGEYERWAAAAAHSQELIGNDAATIVAARHRLIALRTHIRALLYATTAGEALPKGSITTLNRASRAAPHWSELCDDGGIQEQVEGSPIDRLVAQYARSAMEVTADGSAPLRVCGAPSCGMFYRPRRRQQRWCSEPCGNRARFARHYRSRHS